MSCNVHVFVCLCFCICVPSKNKCLTQQIYLKETEEEKKKEEKMCFVFNLFLLSNLDFLQNCCQGGIHIRTTIQLGFTDVDDHDKDNNNKDIKDNYDNNKVYYIKEHDCKDDHKDDTKTISTKF